MFDAEKAKRDKEWEEMKSDPEMGKFIDKIDQMKTGERFATGMLLSLSLATMTKISTELQNEIFAKVCEIVEQNAKIDTINMLYKAKVALPLEAAMYSLKIIDDSKRNREQLVNMLEAAVQAGWKDKPNAKPAAA